MDDASSADWTDIELQLAILQVLKHADSGRHRDKGVSLKSILDCLALTNHQRAQRFIGILISEGYVISVETERPGPYFRITPQGKDYFEAFLKSCGD